MLRLIALLLLVGVSLPLHAENLRAPAGWRFPKETDYSSRWIEYRATFPVPFRVSADFNGDGIEDHAFILIREKGQGFGLFVFLGRKDSAPRTLRLFSHDECCAQLYALALAKPGHHPTVCGQGIVECSPGEPKSVFLRNAGFEFITLGTASGLYYWNAKARAFRSLSVAD